MHYYSRSFKIPGQTGKNDNNFHFEDELLSINHIIVGLLNLKSVTLPISKDENKRPRK